MSKGFKENYLTKENGCQVVQASSERKDTAAMNILTQNPKSMWVIQKKLPQHCIISTSLKNYPRVFNRVGFYCWHQYDSNPSFIEIAYASSEDGEWTVAGKIRLALSSQKQYFKIKQIPVTELKFLKVTLIQNFGDKTTYLNQMQLGYVKEASAVESSREKTFSEFVKLTSTQRQLKRALEQIKMLAGEQELLKDTVQKQNDIIIKLQDSIKKMSKNVEKMNEIQQMQSQKIYELQQVHESKKNSKKQSRQASRQKSEDSQESQLQKKNFIEEALIKNKSTSKTVGKNFSYVKNTKNSSVNKGTEKSFNQSKEGSKMQKLLKYKLEIKGSEPSLSEYNSSQQQKSRNSQKCSQLIRRLQSLLAEKDKRQKELNRKSQNS